MGSVFLFSSKHRFMAECNRRSQFSVHYLQNITYSDIHNFNVMKGMNFFMSWDSMYSNEQFTSISSNNETKGILIWISHNIHQKRNINCTPISKYLKYYTIKFQKQFETISFALFIRHFSINMHLYE